jgi:hypothetical protein
MSSGGVLFALVAGYVALVASYVGIVLWWWAHEDSLPALALLRTRLRRRSMRLWRTLAVALDRSHAAVGVFARTGLGSPRCLAGALAGVAVVGLAAISVVGARDSGSRATFGPALTLRPHLADPAWLRSSRALFPPVAAANARARGQTAKSPSRPQRRTKVVSGLVSVSAHVPSSASGTVSTQAASGASGTVSTQAPPSSGPAPLQAPAASSAPGPLAAP